MIDLSKEKLELNYPCSWKYKLVILETKNIKIIVEEILFNRDYEVKASKVSTKGKFKSFNLDLLVHNEDDRKTIYELLGQHNDIKMVL